MIGETYLRRRFERLHGVGEQHQADVYRCQTCGKLRTWKHIRSADLCCMGRVIPSSPTKWEAVKLLVFPWLV